MSPLIKFARYSALLYWISYGSSWYAYLKPKSEEERRIETEEKKKQEQAARIERELAEQEAAILKFVFSFFVIRELVFWAFFKA